MIAAVSLLPVNTFKKGELIMQKITDIIPAEEIAKWKPGDNILISAPMGAGKSYFCKNTLYEVAKEADYIIYNSTIDGEIYTVEELLGKNELLKDFKAVQNNNVWCTEKNLFQETTQLGSMIKDINELLTNNDPELTELSFLHKLR